MFGAKLKQSRPSQQNAFRERDDRSWRLAEFAQAVDVNDGV